MLTKLTPEQISAYWEIVRYAIANSLPFDEVNNEEGINNILMAMMSGKLHVWASYIREGEACANRQAGLN